MSETTRSFTGQAAIGLIACALAATVLFAELMASVLTAMRPKYGNLATAFSWFVFDYGFPLEVLAVAFAIWAIIRGGRDRRMGGCALLIVALSFAMLFIG